MVKKYKANSHVCLSVILKSGKSAHISFSDITGGGSVFYTGDEELQKALERHVKYGKLFHLVDMPSRVAPVEEKQTAAKADETEGQEKKSGTVKYEVACNDDAKDYLVEKFGISRTKLRSKAQIDAAGLENGVEFVWN